MMKAVMPAKAGIQTWPRIEPRRRAKLWIAAFASITTIQFRYQWKCGLVCSEIADMPAAPIPSPTEPTTTGCETGRCGADVRPPIAINPANSSTGAAKA